MDLKERTKSVNLELIHQGEQTQWCLNGQITLNGAYYHAGVVRIVQCVQRFDGSRISCGLAYHTTYRRLLRSSSNDVPRDPVLLVVKVQTEGSSVEV